MLNDAIQKNQKLINEKIEEIQSLEVNSISKAEPYQQLLNYEELALYEWDKEIINFGKTPVQMFEKTINLIWGLHYLTINMEDYKLSVKNQEIQVLNTKENRTNFIAYVDYLENGKISLESLLHFINESEILYQIYLNSVFFRTEYNLSNYNKGHISKLKELMPELNSDTLESIDQNIIKLSTLKKGLSTQEVQLRDIESKREQLRISYVSHNPNGDYCPYCQKQFQNAEELGKAYNLLSVFLKQGLETDNKEIENIEKNIKSKIKEIFQIVNSKTQTLDDEVVKKLNEKIKLANDFIANSRKVESVEKIAELITERDWLAFLEKDQELQIEILLNSKTLPYSSSNVLELSKQYSFKNLYEEFSAIWKTEQPRLLEHTKVESKINLINAY